MGTASFLLEVEKLLRIVHPRIQLAGLGRKGLDENGSWPRLVWVMPGADHAPAEKSKRSPTDGRQILTRGVNVQAHVLGRDLGMAEQLVHDVIAAVDKCGVGSIAWKGEEWPPDYVTDDGMGAILRFTIMGRVLARRFVAVDPAKDSQFTTTQPTRLDVDSTNAP